MTMLCILVSSAFNFKLTPTGLCKFHLSSDFAHFQKGSKLFHVDTCVACMRFDMARDILADDMFLLSLGLLHFGKNF